MKKVIQILLMIGVFFSAIALAVQTFDLLKTKDKKPDKYDIMAERREQKRQKAEERKRQMEEEAEELIEELKNETDGEK